MSNPAPPVEWLCDPEFPTPGSSSLDIWRLDLDRLPCHTHLLDPQECSRLQAFKHRNAREQFCVSRTSMRTILGRYLKTSPDQVLINIPKGGKPCLDEQHPPLHFNLSHTGNLALLAIRDKHEVGIDVESLRPIPGIERIARRVFSEQEVEQLESRDWPEQLFFETWSHMEARQKCLGRGVFAEPSASNGVQTYGFNLSNTHYAAVAWPKDAPPDVINYYRAGA